MIPFCKTTLGEEEKRVVAKVIDSGWVAQGRITEEFEKEFAAYVGAKYAVFVDSGTAALFLACQYIKTLTRIWPISVPSLTFTSTAEAPINAGFQIQFEDIDKKSWCSDSSITVNLAGVKSPYVNKAIIVDSAHRIERNDMLDATNLWCYSFYATKNMTTINGGMIAMNFPEAMEWFKKARDHGLSKGTRERYEEGQWEYSVDFVGWRMKADDVRAAIGREQLKKLDSINQKRSSVVSLYNALLGLNRVGNHLYPILVEKRADFIGFMVKNGIQCSVHFLPLHKMPAYRNFPKGDLTNTEYLGERLVSLPLFPQMIKEEVQFIAEKTKEFGYLYE